MIVPDTSAVMAILLGEDEAARFSMERAAAGYEKVVERV